MKCHWDKLNYVFCLLIFTYFWRKTAQTCILNIGKQTFFYFSSLMQHFCYMTCFYKLPKATSRRPKQNLIQTDVTFKIHVLFVSYLCSIFTIPLKKERTEQGVISTRCPVGVCITKAQIRNNFASPRVIKLKFWHLCTSNHDG